MREINNGQCYWYNTGTHEVINKKLWDLIPPMGSVHSAAGKNKKLEKYRKASRVYYDLYNNGLCNRSRSIFPLFGINADNARMAGRYGSDSIESLIETTMDNIILDA